MHHQRIFRHSLTPEPTPRWLLNARAPSLAHQTWIVVGVVALTVALTLPTRAIRAAETDPAVLAIQESVPDSPAKRIRASKILINLRRHDLAKEYIQQVINQQLSTPALSSLHDQFGPALFIGLAGDPDLQPSGAELSQLVLAAAHETARDPRRIERLITDLASDMEETRFRAIVELQRSGTAAIWPLLAVLADKQRAAAHPAARTTMLALGPAAVEPLIAALAADKPLLRVSAVQLLAHLRDRRAVAYLVGPAFSAAEDAGVQMAARRALRRIAGVDPQRWDVEQLLSRQIEQVQSGQSSRTADLQQQIPRWRWHQEDQSLVMDHVDIDVARAQVTAQLAKDLELMVPERQEYRLQALTAQLLAAKLEVGLDQPLPPEVLGEASACGSDLLEAVLQRSMRSQQPAAAIASLEVLERIGTVELVATSSLRPRPIVRALDDPHRRVRFVAAKTIMHINPHVPYAGSSRLVKALVHLGTATGKRRALVGFPRLARGSEIASLLEEFGFATDLVTDSRQFFRLATQLADYDLAFLSDATGWPDAHQLLQSLRLDPLSAELPVAVMARMSNGRTVDRITEQDPLAIAVVEPFSVDAVRLHIRDLMAVRGRHYVSPEERLRYAQLALSWLVDLAEDEQRYGFYDVLCWESQLERALYVPELSLDAARLLGLLGSPAAQRALVDLVSENVLPIEQRQAAASALQTAVDRRGILLTTDEILTQYERYNASQNLKKETQTVLGSILDSIESRRHSGES